MLSRAAEKTRWSHADGRTLVLVAGELVLFDPARADDEDGGYSVLPGIDNRQKAAYYARNHGFVKLPGKRPKQIRPLYPDRYCPCGAVLTLDEQRQCFRCRPQVEPQSPIAEEVERNLAIYQERIARGLPVMGN